MLIYKTTGISYKLIIGNKRNKTLSKIEAIVFILIINNKIFCVKITAHYSSIKKISLSSKKLINTKTCARPNVNHQLTLASGASVKLIKTN